MLFDEVAKFEHHASSAEGRGRGPFGKCRGGGFHSGIDIGPGAYANFTRELTGRGIEDVAEVVCAFNMNPRPGDEMRNSVHASVFARTMTDRKPRGIRLLARGSLG